MAEAKKILVVDDDPDIRELFDAYLSKKGYKIDIAKSGLEAIQKTDSDEFDFIFLDIKKSGLDGVETFKRIKEKKPQSRIIIMTGYRTMAQELISDSLKEQIHTILYGKSLIQQTFWILASGQKETTLQAV